MEDFLAEAADESFFSVSFFEAFDAVFLDAAAPVPTEVFTGVLEVFGEETATAFFLAADLASRTFFPEDLTVDFTDVLEVFAAAAAAFFAGALAEDFEAVFDFTEALEAEEALEEEIAALVAAADFDFAEFFSADFTALFAGVFAGEAAEDFFPEEDLDAELREADETAETSLALDVFPMLTAFLAADFFEDLSAAFFVPVFFLSALAINDSLICLHFSTVAELFAELIRSA